MRIGPTDRGGFTPLANAEAERLFNELKPEQFRFYVGLRIEAQYGEACERRDAFGRPVLLEPGEVLFGIDSAAARYGLNRDQVRRAIDRFEQLGLVGRRIGVAAAIPPSPEPATPHGLGTATPPTVLTFLTDREICWRGKRTTIPPEPAPATPPEPVAAPIQHRNTGTPNTEKREPAAAEPRPAPPSGAKGSEEETAAARVLRELAEHVFLELRGERYMLPTKQAIIADRVAARNLLTATAGDLSAIEARWRKALANEDWPRVDSLADLAKHWARFSPSPAVARRRLAEASKRAAGGLELDPTWLGSLDPAVREEASSAWDARREYVERRSWWTPEDKARALQDARAAFVAEFSKRSGVAAGAA